MIVIAFHSTDAYYVEEARRLQECLDRVGMAHEIQPVEGLADWYAATAYKAEFCRAMREKHAGPILYIDVDAIVHENCESYFQDIDADFGVHYFQGPSGGYDMARNDNRMLSGTLWFGDTVLARHLIASWCHFNSLWKAIGCPEGGGQKNLWFLTTCLPELRIHKLPGRFCYVFDKAGAYPDGEPRIIEHLIASRENRGASKGNVSRARITRLAEIEAERALA